MNTLLLFVAFLLLNFVIASAKYHWSHRSRRDAGIPPKYPSIFPVIGDIVSSVWDNQKFYQNVT